MEATSARFAGSYGPRDRYGAFGEAANSTLQRYIYNACDPQNMEPNLAINLEIADLVNSKKGNAPREAAMTIVQLINSRNPNISLLALALLDICVKNCGYAFHLQISSKEFLNELVRRFPERPPIRPSRVQSRILESIEEWQQTICQTSRYKEDLGFIRDMHRLLQYKGYMFPEVRREDAAVLNPSDNLKSAEEMEQEEQAAHSAKLQELVRRGGPQDLQEANRLMKVMAGYDTRHKTDYRAKAAEEVGKIQEKAKILEEMLQSSHSGQSAVEEGGVFEELASALQSAQPKIQKMCEENTEDSEAVAKLLEINDSIHRTVERYKLIKKGDIEGAEKIPQGTLGTRTGVSKNSANELSLIDFDPETTAGPEDDGASTKSKAGNVEDDLLGLSIGDQRNNGPGGIMLGQNENIAVSGATLSSSLMAASTTGAAISPPQQANPVRANYDAVSPSGSSNPPGSQLSQGPPVLPQHQPAPAPVPKDPFAALVSSTSRSQSPSVPGLPGTMVAKSSSLLDISTPSPSEQTASSKDEEWTFTSSLPAASLATSNRVDVLASWIQIAFVASRPAGESDVHILAEFSNNTSQPIRGVHFQVAVKKSYTLQLHPQTGRDMNPHQSNGIRQEIILQGVPAERANSVEMRFKVSYEVDNEGAKEEQGQVPALGIA